MIAASARTRRISRRVPSAVCSTSTDSSEEKSTAGLIDTSVVGLRPLRTQLETVPIRMFGGKRPCWSPMW